ncbi:MAG: hypothetical protein PSY14_01820 [bacterium]|nr:hypothetical protein [bacterium]
MKKGLLPLIATAALLLPMAPLPASARSGNIRTRLVQTGIFANAEKTDATKAVLRGLWINYTFLIRIRFEEFAIY